MDQSERKVLSSISEIFEEDVHIYHVTGMFRKRLELIENIAQHLGY